MRTRAGNFYIGLSAMKNPVMSIQSIKSLASSVPATAMDAKASQLSKPFVRNAMAGKTSNVAPASAKDANSMALWRHEVFKACEEQGLARGEEKYFLVDGKFMVLRHTETGDTYTFQTQQQKHDNRFSGLQLKKNLEMRYNTEVAGYDCSNKEATQQFMNLAHALGVPPGGVENDIGFSLLTSR